MPDPTTLAPVDGDPLVGRTLKVFLWGTGYNVQALEHPFEGDLGAPLGGARLLLLLAPTPEARGVGRRHWGDTGSELVAHGDADERPRRSPAKRRARSLRVLAVPDRGAGAASMCRTPASPLRWVASRAVSQHPYQYGPQRSREL